jgi:hypothetical protein
MVVRLVLAAAMHPAVRRVLVLQVQMVVRVALAP